MSLSMRTILVASAASIAIVASLALAAAPSALAGTYTVYGCRTPSGAGAPLNGWQGALDPADDTGHEFWGGTCPGPYFLKLDPFFSHIEGASVAATFVAPADTTISSYAIWRAVRLVPSAGFLYQAWALSAGRWLLVDGCGTASSCGTYGNVSNLAAPSNLLRQGAPPDTTELQLKLVCARSGGCPSVSPQSDAVWLWSSAITLTDTRAPQFAGAPSGPLVAPGAVLAGVVPVSLAASDRGGGVYQALVEIDGRVLARQVLASNGGLCNAPFLAVVPCLLSAGGTVDVNTAGLPDGAHSLMLLVSDPAGNTTSWGPVEIVTSNNPCTPFPAAAGMNLRASFIRRVHKRIRLANEVTTANGYRPIVQGALTTATGAPAPGAAICVATRDDYPGAPLTPVGTFSTDGAGRFSYKLGLGPSRTIYFIHRVPGGAIATALGVHVRVPVRVRVNAHRLRNDQAMTWRGRLPGPVPNGLLALMQVWRGHFWQTFKKIGVRTNGEWVGRYRFSFTSGVQHYRFRLTVPRQSGYPYAAGVSGVIHMTVTG